MPSYRDRDVQITAAIVATVAVAAILFVNRQQLQWGTVPTWLAGGFALAASVISLHSLRTSRHSLEISRASIAQATEKRDDDYAAQARLVVCEVEDMGDTHHLRMRNHSDSIIFNATLVAYRIERDDTRTYVPLFPDGPHPDEYDDQTLTPKQHSYWQEYDNLQPPFEYVASYTDARGVRWRRFNKQQPERVIDTRE